MPQSLPSATPWEEIAEEPQEMAPPGPYTAARFARWDQAGKVELTSTADVRCPGGWLRAPELRSASPAR